MADYQLDHILRQLKNIADLLHDIRQQTAVPVAPRYTAEVNFRDLPTLQPQPPMFEGPDEDFDGHLPLGDPLTSPHRTARATRALLGLPEVDPLNDDPDDDLSRRARLYDDPPSDD